ncbi:MAG: capsule biosynthesis protein [Candidatus Melainabacteria bacterium]|nr:MAG: capsule biosynthesis protein [Candidatus Melainabacteria bacterium]
MNFKKLLNSVNNLLSSKKFQKVETESTPTTGWLDDGYSWIPNWKVILGNDYEPWLELASKPKTGPRVLITTITGGNSALTPLETAFGVALTLRGADVHYLICDKAIPACQNSYGSDLDAQKLFVENGPSICDWCYKCGDKSLQQLGLPLHKLSDFISNEERITLKERAQTSKIDDILNSSEFGIELGETIRAAALRYFARGDFEGEELCLPVLQRYYEAALISSKSFSNLMEQYNFQHIVSNQGLYVPQGNIVAIAKKLNADVVTWDLAYRSGSIHMSHDKTHIHSFLNEPISDWESMSWNKENENDIHEYLQGRWTGKFDWLKIVTQGADQDPDDISSQIGLDPNKKTIGLLTNVIWDEQLCYASNAFENQIAWLIQTVEYFRKREDLQLVVRVHPAELNSWMKSRQLAIDEIENAFSPVPKNVFLIPPDSTINTYKAMMLCDSVLIYGTTTGLELSCMKIPVIVAGEAWIRGKGISFDVSSPSEYTQMLDQLPLNKKLSEDRYSRAIKYAYHYYFRKMIPLGIVEPSGFENAPYKIKDGGLSNFERGADTGLDLICDGILKKEPFIFKRELLELSSLKS